MMLQFVVSIAAFMYSGAAALELAVLPGKEPTKVEVAYPRPWTTSQCLSDLKQYMLCDAANGMYLACHNVHRLANPRLQKLLGCDGADLPACKRACFQYTRLLMNGTVPCPVSYTAMKRFSGQINLFALTTEEDSLVQRLNMSIPPILPMPNFVSDQGAAVVDLGEPGKCAQVTKAHYCVIAMRMTGPSPKMSFSLSLGACVPASCSEEELQHDIDQIGLPATAIIECDVVQSVHEAEGINKQAEELLGWGGMPVKYVNRQEITPGVVVTIGVVVTLLCLVVAGTTLEWLRESKVRRMQALMQTDAPELPHRSKAEEFFHHWSLLRNARSFLRTRPANKNPFACLDCIRSISMLQVILGHMFAWCMSTVGFSNIEQFLPPYGLASSLGFQTIPGCFYAVDSFFLMSGFLCAFGLQRKVFCKPENQSATGFLKMYPKFVLVRYLRLLPTEMFCILFAYYAAPFMGQGVLWNMQRPDGSSCVDNTGAAPCNKYWWTNLLFIQNFIPAYTASGTTCYGHSWYLAVDMQIYLTAPFFSVAYSYAARWGWLLLGLAALLSIGTPMAMVWVHNYIPDTLLGGAEVYTADYANPISRAAPFLAGIAFGWLWQTKLEKLKGPILSIKSRMISLAVSAVGLLLMASAVFGRTLFYQCEILDCLDPSTNPAGRVLAYVWAGFARLTWSVGLGIVMILCFQGRFLPLIQNVMNQSFWQPLAKLCYSAYLIHPTVLTINYCSRTNPIEFTRTYFIYLFLSFVAVTLGVAFVILVVVEKPLANLQNKLLGTGDE